VSLSRTHSTGPSPTRATSATITTITTHPGTVVIEAVHAVVAQAAVRGPRRPEDLAGETVFQLDRLSFDQDLLGPRRRSICGTVQRVWHLYSRRFGLSTHVHTHIFPYSKKKKIGGKGKSFLILNILYKGNNSNSLAQRQRSVRL